MSCYRSALGIKCLLYRGSVNGLLFFSRGLLCHTNQSLGRRPIKQLGTIWSVVSRYVMPITNPQ